MDLLCTTISSQLLLMDFDSLTMAKSKATKKIIMWEIHIILPISPKKIISYMLSIE
jgi:hypothetical protein